MSTTLQPQPKSYLEVVVEKKQAALDALSPLERLAHDIHRDYEAAMHGIRCYVTMGIRLHMVKESLKHGEFLAWCKANLTINKRHIANSMLVAKNVCEIAEIEMCSALHFCQNPENPLFEIIDGKSQRQLLSEIHEYRDDQIEQEHKVKCEERWDKNPVERDDWEPQVLSGEKTYTLAWRGMMGFDATKDKPRHPVKYEELLRRNAHSYKLIFKDWEKISPEVKMQCAESWQDLIAAMPDELLNLSQKVLKTKE